MADMDNSALGGSSGAKGISPSEGLLGYGRGAVLLMGGMGALLIPLLVGGSVAMASAMTEPTSVTAEQSPGGGGGSDSDGSTTDPGRDSGQSHGSSDGTTASDDPNGSEGSDEDGSSSDEQRYQEDVTHIVKWGETLTSISRDYGVSIDMIAEYNHIDDVDLIYADSAMLIPYSELKIPVDD